MKTSAAAPVSRRSSGGAPHRDVAIDHWPIGMLTMQHSVGNRAVQRLLGEGAGTDRPSEEEVARRIDEGAGGGQPLDRAARRQLEQAMGADLAGVRVHTGAEADGLARSLGARAFTSGQDVWFRSGAYDPSSTEGLRTLAHEVAHTLQQATGPVSGRSTPGGSLAVSDPDDRFERAAHATAAAVVADAGTRPAFRAEQGSVPKTSPGRSIQREEDWRMKDHEEFKLQFDPKLQAQNYPQIPGGDWLVDPTRYLPTGAQYDVRSGGLTTSGQANLAGAQSRFKYQKMVPGKDGKPVYEDVAAAKGDFNWDTKEGSAEAFAKLKLDPVEIKALVELSTKKGVEGSVEAATQLEALKLKAILAGGSGGLDAKVMADYGFDKSSISGMLGAGSAGFSAEALAKLNFGKTEIEAMMKYGPAGAEGSLKGSQKLGLAEITAFMNANAQTTAAGVGAKVNFPGGYSLGGSLGTAGYTGTASMPINPLTFGGGMTPVLGASVAGDWEGQAAVMPTLGVTF